MKKTITLSALLFVLNNLTEAQVTVTVSTLGPSQICSPPWIVTMIASPIPPGYTYQWHQLKTTPQNGCNTDYLIPPATFNSYGATESGFYYVVVLDQFMDPVTASYPPTCIKMLPGQVPVSSSGPSVNCSGTGYVELCVGQHWEDYYNASTGVQWMRNGVNIPGAVSSTYNATLPGVYKCRVHNICATAFSDSIVVTLQPAASVTPLGPTTFCSGGSVVLDASASNGNAYQWKKNGAVISGATSSSYTASAAGNYTVIVTNSCGSVTSPATSVTVNPLPSAAITPAGPTTFCTGGSVVLNAPVAANRTYQWKKYGVNIPGATLSSYTVTTGGSYKVTVTNTITGCARTTAGATVVTVNTKPAATVTPQGPTTFCAGGSVVLKANPGTGLTYKWKKGGNIIPGATQQNYTATTAGTYKVTVTNANTCSKTSAGTVVTVPCREGEINLGNIFDVKVFPNPSSGDFTFEISNPSNEKTLINVYDMVGKLVFSESIDNSTFVIDNSKLTPGVYSAIITIGNYRKAIRIIKTI